MRYEISRECPLSIPRRLDPLLLRLFRYRSRRRSRGRRSCDSPLPSTSVFLPRREPRFFPNRGSRFGRATRSSEDNYPNPTDDLPRRGDDTSAAATDGKIRYKAQPCAPAIKILALRSDHRAAYVIGQIRSHDYEEPRRSRTALPGCNRRVQGSRLQGSPGFTGECSRQLTYDP